MIERLPDLPIELILSMLSYEDRFSLRRTCKLLKCLVDGQMHRNLFVFLDCYPCRRRLFHSDELVYYPDSCRIAKFDTFSSSDSKEQFKWIRKLTIYFDDFKFIFTELDRLVIDLDELNFFQELEHLEIGMVGWVTGQLNSKKLKVVLIETTGTAKFNLQCEQLRAMRISCAARPNFTSRNDHLTCLSVRGMGDVADYLPELLRQCPNLSSISSDFVGLLKLTLTAINSGHLRLPHLKEVKFERPQYFKELDEKLVELLAAHERRIRPEKLQIVFNDERISLQELAPIVRLHKKFHNSRYENEELFVFKNDRLDHLYFKFLLMNSPQPDWLFSGIKAMPFERIALPIDEALVMRLKNLEIINLKNTGDQLDERLFKTMLTNWSELLSLNIARPVESIGQDRLELMHQSGCWPNLHVLALCERPDDFGFVPKFKNLKALCFCFNLKRNELVFFFRTCGCLEILSFSNSSTGFKTDLVTRRFARYDEDWAGKYQLWHGLKYWGLDSDFRRKFDSLEQLVDFYYERDLFNRKEITSIVKKFKNLFRSRD